MGLVLIIRLLPPSKKQLRLATFEAERAAMELRYKQEVQRRLPYINQVRGSQKTPIWHEYRNREACMLRWEMRMRQWDMHISVVEKMSKIRLCIVLFVEKYH